MPTRSCASAILGAAVLLLLANTSASSSASSELPAFDKSSVNAVWFVSHGGVGHTHISRFVIRKAVEAAGFKMNTDTGTDGLKHPPWQGIHNIIKNNLKSHDVAARRRGDDQEGRRESEGDVSPLVVVLFDDPVHATLSLIRRRFARPHTLALHNDKTPAFDRDKASLRQFLITYIPSTLPGYLDSNADLIGIASWLDGYLQAACSSPRARVGAHANAAASSTPILFMRTSTLHRTITHFADLLGLDHSLIDFGPLDPQYIQEQAQTELSSAGAARLTKLFADYTDAINSQALDFALVTPGHPCSFELKKIARRVSEFADTQPHLLKSFHNRAVR